MDLQGILERIRLAQKNHANGSRPFITVWKVRRVPRINHSPLHSLPTHRALTDQYPPKGVGVRRIQTRLIDVSRSGAPLPLSGPESLQMTHHLRAMHDAILVGVLPGVVCL